ncbi:MAG: BrnT family toxin [Acidobacteria bacterium]|nr:BrnT family toxin [Acidobacteriota bacterium]
MAEPKDPLDSCAGFEWDEANGPKNWERHGVTKEEAEDVSFNKPLVVRSDIRHTRREKRYYALGQTSRGRCLFIAFTIGRNLIRVISVRDMNRREQDFNGKHDEEEGASLSL